MRQDWIACDGNGRSAQPETPAFLSRRNLLLGGAGAWVGFGANSALAQVAIAPAGARRTDNVLVVVFLRGGADGLSLVVPHGEDAYHRNRPSLRLASPNDRTASAGDRCLDLDGFFGLHPALAPLLPFYRDGSLAAVHACGSGDATHSHFEAMAAIERGLAAEGEGPASGWIARHLAATARPEESPLRAIALGATLPDSLRGATHAVAMTTLDDYRLQVDEPFHRRFFEDLEALCRSRDDAAARAGLGTLDALKSLAKVDLKAAPARDAKYPSSDLGQGLQTVAALVRAEVGLEIACLDRGGWDTHVAQGVGDGWLAGLLKDLGDSLAAFAADLGPAMKNVTVLAISEFGRRVAENSGLGTDHGHGSALFAFGGGVRGGRVVAKWPGLEDHQLYGPGDLQATTDYRDVLAEALAVRLGNAKTGEVFPGFDRGPLGLFAA